MSPSVTGEPSVPLVHRLKGWRAVARASSPASRTIASSGALNARTSLTGNGQALHAQCRSVCCVTKFKIIGRSECAEHVEQIARNGDSTHGVRALAIFNPESRSAATVVAGYHVRPHADEIGDIKSIVDVRYQRIRSQVARLQMYIAWSWSRHRRTASLGISGRDESEFPSGRAVE